MGVSKVAPMTGFENQPMRREVGWGGGGSLPFSSEKRRVVVFNRSRGGRITLLKQSERRERAWPDTEIK